MRDVRGPTTPPMPPYWSMPEPRTISLEVFGSSNATLYYHQITFHRQRYGNYLEAIRLLFQQRALVFLETALVCISTSIILTKSFGVLLDKGPCITFISTKSTGVREDCTLVLVMCKNLIEHHVP